MSDTAQGDEIDRQRAYYERTAGAYDDAHRGEPSEHDVALTLLAGFLPSLDVRSALDVGTGTGRAMHHLRAHLPPGARVSGVEPVAALRARAVEQGIPAEDLYDASGLDLPFEDGAFDLVCEFGALHHVPDPTAMVDEMLRVARRAVFISDSNNFGQGGRLSRRLKQALHGAKLWPAFDFLRTRGRGYMESEGDGIFYSYSVFDNLPQLQRSCSRVYLMNTRGKGTDLYRDCDHLAVLAIK